MHPHEHSAGHRSTRRSERGPGDGAVTAIRTIIAVALVVLQMGLLQIAVEDALAGRAGSLVPTAALSIGCFLLIAWLFSDSER